jgi:citrate synthase
LSQIDARCRAGAERETAAAESLALWRKQNGRFIPGFGHRFHGTDPRAERISGLLREAAVDGVIDGRFLAIGQAVQHQLARGKSSPPAMNIDGATAVLLLELGFACELGRGIFVLSRSVGICAHAFEQLQRGERIKGPIPPEIGFHYSGVGPRKLPDGETLP